MKKSFEDNSKLVKEEIARSRKEAEDTAKGIDGKLENKKESLLKAIREDLVSLKDKRNIVTI